MHVDGTAPLVPLGDAGSVSVTVQNPHELVGHVEQRRVVSRPHNAGYADTLAAHRFGFLVYPRSQFAGHVGPQWQPCGFAILGVDTPQHDDRPLVVEQHVTDGKCRQFAPPQARRYEHGIEQRTFPAQAFKPLDNIGTQPPPAPLGGSDDGVGRQFGTLPRRPRLRRSGVVDNSDGSPPVLGDGDPLPNS